MGGREEYKGTYKDLSVKRAFFEKRLVDDPDDAESMLLLAEVAEEEERRDKYGTWGAAAINTFNNRNGNIAVSMIKASLLFTALGMISRIGY